METTKEHMTRLEKEGRALMILPPFRSVAKWLVVEYDAGSAIDLGGKTKIPKGVVVFCGNLAEATTYLRKHAPGRAIVGETVSVGGYGTATVGDYGTASAGYRGTATAGCGGTATAGYEGTASAGDYGMASAGNYGTATAGDYGTASAGREGTVSAGVGGTLHLRRFDHETFQDQIVTAYVGEDGIEPNIPYRLDAEGRFAKVSA